MTFHSRPVIDVKTGNRTQEGPGRACEGGGGSDTIQDGGQKWKSPLPPHKHVTAPPYYSPRFITSVQDIRGMYMLLLRITTYTLRLAGVNISKDMLPDSVWYSLFQIIPVAVLPEHPRGLISVIPMRCENQRSSTGPYMGQGVPQPSASNRIHTSRGFIQENHRRVTDQCNPGA